VTGVQTCALPILRRRHAVADMPHHVPVATWVNVARRRPVTVLRRPLPAVPAVVVVMPRVAGTPPLGPLRIPGRAVAAAIMAPVAAIIATLGTPVAAIIATLGTPVAAVIATLRSEE